MSRLSVCLVALAACATAALAHTGAMGVVKQRMDAMKQLGDGIKSIAAMVKAEAEFDAAAAEMSARMIARHASEMPALFPEGSLDKPTEALPVIWARWDDFTGIAKQMEADAMALAEASRSASSAEDILPHLAEVGKSCKACHQDFRLAK
jgi:cytochrome c556